MERCFPCTIISLFINALDSNDTNPCASAIPGVNDKLCEALVDQDLTDIDLCHAVDDTLAILKISLQDFL
jgi:hypothetical protein